MSYQIAKPSALLSPYVKYYWTLTGCSGSIEEKHFQRIVPSGLNELNFYFSKLPVSSDNSFDISDRSMVSGLLNRFYDLEIKGDPGIFSVVFEPGGLYHLLGIAVQELYNRTIPLNLIPHNDACLLESRLYESDDFIFRIKIMEEYLEGKLKNAQYRSHVDRIGYISHLIKKKKALVEIEELASSACFSRKQFERVFAEQIGTSPKKYLKTVRFQYAVYEKARFKDLSLTDLSYRCGYFDQSHMIHDFLKLTGMTPKEYFTSCEPFSDFFNK